LEEAMLLVKKRSSVEQIVDVLKQAQVVFPFSQWSSEEQGLWITRPGGPSLRALHVCERENGGLLRYQVWSHGSML
jgi:hypothetical protein